MVDRAETHDLAALQLLERHPRVTGVVPGDFAGIRFYQGTRAREVRVADPTAEVFGLLELADNNPVVCADSVSVPSPVSTLALIALGPIADAGLLADTPTVVTNVEADEDDLNRSLVTCGWQDGALLHVEPVDLEWVVTITAMAAIRTPEDPADIDALYEERFGRSFFVHRDETSVWDPGLVRGTPQALFRFTLALDQPESLLTVRVLADLNGKAGAAQLVHAMNIMCGFEESLGIA